MDAKSWDQTLVLLKPSIALNLEPRICMVSRRASRSFSQEERDFCECTKAASLRWHFQWEDLAFLSQSGGSADVHSSKACHHLFCLPFKIWVIRPLEYMTVAPQMDAYRCEIESVRSFTTWILTSASGKIKNGWSIKFHICFQPVYDCKWWKRRSNSSFTTQNSPSWSPVERFISLFCVWHSNRMRR